MVRTLDEEMEIVRATLDAFPRFKGVQANERLLLEACQGQPANASTVRAALANIKHKLAVNGDYATAYDQLWQRYPQFRTEANIHILDSIANVHKTVTYEILLKIIESPDVRSKLVLTPQADRAVRDEAERLRLIEEILQGKDVYEWRGNRDGRLYSGTRAELEQDDLPRLREINEIVQFQRALYARPTAEVRQEQKAAELRQAQIRARMIPEKAAFATVPDFYEPPGRPGVQIPFTENLLRRLSNSEIERLFTTFGEIGLTLACRKNELK